MNKIASFILTAILFLVFAVLLVKTASAGYYYDDNYYGASKPNYVTDYSKETTEFKKTTFSKTESPWGYEKKTTSFIEKTTVEREDKTPINIGYYPFNYKIGYYPSSWRYKPDYKYIDYGKDDYRKPYYYQPRYDSVLDNYNWRY